KRQTVDRHRLEPAWTLLGRPPLAAGVRPELRIIEVRGRYEKGADDAAALQLVGRVNEGRNAERMRNGDDGLRRAARELRHAVAPNLDVRVFPVFLDDAARCPEVPLPAGLPMVGARVLPAGHQKNIDFGSFHRDVLSGGARPGKEAG